MITAVRVTKAGLDPSGAATMLHSDSRRFRRRQEWNPRLNSPFFAGGVGVRDGQ